MVEVIIAACGGAGVAGIFSLISWALNRRAKKVDEQEAKSGYLADGIQILLYDRLKYLAKHHIGAGQITAEDLEDIMRMHTIYHDELNGNGYLDSLIDAVKELKIIK